MPRFAACAPQKDIIQSGGAMHVALPLLLFHIGMTTWWNFGAYSV